MTTFEPPQRHIQLDGTHNLRDIGGYATRDGHQTRWGVLLRSDSLHALPEASQQALIERGLRTVIDLRDAWELKRWPNVFARSPAITYRNFPLATSGEGDSDEAPLPLLHIYRHYLEAHQDALRGVFKTLTASDAAPALVHCFIGKDRTGLVIALALSVVGVPDETIARDYALSHDLLVRLLQEIRATIIAHGHSPTRFDHRIHSHQETMLALLAYLHERYGGAEAYLHHIGLDDDALARLRGMLVE